MVRRRWLWFSMLLLPAFLAATSYAVWGRNPWTVTILALCAICGFLVWSHGDLVADFAYAGGTGGLLILTVTGATGYQFDPNYRDFWGGLLRMTVTAAVSGGSAALLILLYEKAREHLRPRPTPVRLEAIPNSVKRLKKLFREVELATKRERVQIESSLSQAQEIVLQQAAEVEKLNARTMRLQSEAEDAKQIAAMSESERKAVMRLFDRRRRRDQALAFVLGVLASLVANALWNAPRLFRP